MQSRLTWLMFALFAVCIMSIGIVGCGGDDDDTEETADVTTPTTSASGTGGEVVVASRPEIDYAAEKAAIQAVYSDFYAGFNDQDIKAIQETYETSQAVFGTIFAGNEPVPLTKGWNDVKVAIEGLWIGIGTAGNKWGQNNTLSLFWIRYKGSKLEASAIGYNCFKGSFPGETHLYLQKDDKGEWKIHEIDSITENNLGIFGYHKGKPRLEEAYGNFFDDEEDSAP